MKMAHPRAPSNYRPDIDGLRAVAVLSVVAYHGFPKQFHGGFIGVDIFFVISGYLITQIVLKGVERNEFSILAFYGRRIRRIFPALLVVIAFCLVAGWLIMFLCPASAASAVTSHCGRWLCPHPSFGP
jgi:peptidoglycan/LPS O-acetylase OafA/YrhL